MRIGPDRVLANFSIKLRQTTPGITNTQDELDCPPAEKRVEIPIFVVESGGYGDPEAGYL